MPPDVRKGCAFPTRCPLTQARRSLARCGAAAPRIKEAALRKAIGFPHIGRHSRLGQTQACLMEWSEIRSVAQTFSDECASA